MHTTAGRQLGAGLALGVTTCAFAYTGTHLMALSSPCSRSHDKRPCPSERERRDVFDGSSKKWDETVRWDEFITGISRWRRTMAQRAEGEVLEVACGTGRNFSYYNSARVRSLTGVDFSRGMLEVADGKRAELGAIPLKLKVATSQKLDFEDSSFDTVVDSFGICSFEHPVQALQEMKRVVKEDGKVLLLEHGASSWEMVQGMLNRGAHYHAEKFGCYPNRDIVGLVKEAGLFIEVDDRKHFGTTYSLVCRKSPPKDLEVE